MKTKTLLFTAILAIMTMATSVAQTPMSFTYQGVVRSSSGLLVANSTVGVKISILQGSFNGPVVYSVVQTPRTNANGLFTIIIGDSQNPIDTITWANGPYYLQSEVDPNGGTNYTLSTVQQMFSVPYALHAHTVDNVNFVEQQALTLSGDTIFLTGGSSVVLPASFSGNYNDLTNKPTNVSTFTNDAGYLTNATLTEHQNLSDVATLNDSINSQIKNLYNPTDSMDAVNLRTLNNYIAAITHHYDSIINNMARVIDTLRTLVSDSTPTVTPTPLPAGALEGLFSVGNGKQVRFSKGNLQWTATGTHTTADSTALGTWRFAEHQWDTIGTANDSISSSYTGWIDLFGWGTSGWNSGAVEYQPYSNSLNHSDYYPGDTHTTDLYGAYANADWGVYNAISNGGNQPGMWRTLTKVEWDTLINLRNTTSGIRFAKANVNGVPGLIIVPDNWSNSTYALNNANTATVNHTSNTITSSQWTILENAGCAFLPAAGSRGGSNPNTGNVAIAGYYWSSKCIAAMSAWSFNIVVTGTASSSIQLWSGNRNTGRSVRLVQDVQ